MMKLHKRMRGSNIYDLGQGKRRSVLGGVPNVPYNIHGDLKPLDNRLKVDLSHPTVRYLLRQGAFEIGFHKKSSNKYLSALRLRTGETLKKTLVGDVACTPTVIKGERSIRWTYPNGSWIEETATEKKVKEMVYQKKGQVIKFKYKLNGLTAKNKKGFWKFKRQNGKIAFKIEKPYYCKKNGEFLSDVPVTWQKINETDFVVTYPAPSADCYIDPVIVFGEGGGAQIGGDHKTTVLRSDLPNRSFGDDVEMRLDANGIFEGLLRWSLVGHIPTNAIINSAVASVWSNQNSTEAKILTFSRMVTNWGQTLTATGPSQNPANLSQAVWNFAYAVGTAWAGGGAITGADYGAPTAVINQPNGDPAGTGYTVDLTAGATLDVLDDATQYGYHVASDSNTLMAIRSQNHVIVGTRPYLTVDYSLPVSAQRINQSKLHIGINMGI